MLTFTLTEAVKNIYRYRRRYLLFGIILFVTAAAVLSTLTISLTSQHYVDNIEPQYNKLGFEMFNEEAAAVREIYYMSNLLTLIFGLLGAVTLLFISTLHISERIRDIGILYALGVSKRRIFAGLALETLIFIFAVLIIAAVCAAVISNIVLGGIEPQFNYIGAAVISLILTLMPISILVVKTKKTVPTEMLKGEAR